MSSTHLIHITVDYLLPIGLGPHKGPLEVELEPNSTIGDLLTYLLEKYGKTIRQLLVQKDDETPYVTFLVNGEQAELGHVLAPGDKVLIMPPIAGG